MSEQAKKFLDDAFIEFDPAGDGTGGLNAFAFARLIRKYCSTKDAEFAFSEEQAAQIIEKIDVDGNGTIEIDEFGFFFNVQSYISNLPFNFIALHIGRVV